MADFVNVGKVEDFPRNKVKGIEVNGKAVAVVRVRGNFFAFDNECTHTGVPLDISWITEKDEVICLRHDAIFDMRTGKLTDGPGLDDIAVYTIRVEGDDVLLSTD